MQQTTKKRGNEPLPAAAERGESSALCEGFACVSRLCLVLSLSQGSMISFLWNWLLIVMLLWFLKSIVESSVQERMADRDARRIEEWLAAHEEKAGVTTRRMEERIHEQHPNLPAVLSTSAAAAEAAEEALAIESSGSLLGKVPRETPRDKAAKTGSNKKKAVASGAESNKKNSH